jgi:alpha-L-fucosidase
MMTRLLTQNMLSQRAARTVSAVLLAGILLGAPTMAAQQPTTSVDPHATETKAQRDARMGWWRQARFGMFIHWGLYAVPAGVWDGKPTDGAGEWIMHDLKIPVADYAAYAKQFDPEQFNADQWVSIAKAAGMKYIVMTAKHHEGFAMFPTKVDDFNINAQTLFKRDPIGEMAAACKKAGIKFGVYYSQNLDWHHPGGGTAGPAWDPAQEGDFDAYVKNVSAPQVKELITRYHPAVLWWDINGPFTPDQVRELTAAFPDDPGLIANNRLGGGVPGDTETPEQHIPPTGYPGKDWETCMTINDTWGYKTNDTDFKSVPTLLHNLIDIASKGGNYLLNVGPTAQGIIPAPEVERLQAMGAWLKTNGEAIYGTSASPFKRLPFDGRVTVKGDTLYLHVFQWPDAGLTLAGLKTPVRDARTLVGRQKLTVQTTPDGMIHISRPAQLDPLATVVALRLSGPPMVDAAQLLPAVAPQADGSYILLPVDADIKGGYAQVEQYDGKDNIGYWTDYGSVSWNISVPKDLWGVYHVQLEYACDPNSAGSTYTIGFDNTTIAGLTANVQSTGSWQTYVTVAPFGGDQFSPPPPFLLTPGKHKITISPFSIPHGAVMNLRRIILTPAVKAP